MKKFKLTHLTVCILAAIPLVAAAKDTSQLQKLDTDTTGIEVAVHEQEDSSRIYLKEGAIWASRDITRFDPVLDVSIGDELEVADGKLTDSVNFTISSNYSYYMARYQIEVYRGQDRSLSQPLKIITGTEVANDIDISWDGSTDVDYTFAPGEQLQFRFKAWDKDDNMDVTTIGIADLVNPDSEVDIDRNDSEDKLSRSYGRATLMRHNIPTNAGLAKFIGTGLKGVDKVVIGEDEFEVEEGELYAEQFLPADAYVFPTKVIFDNGDERLYQLYVRIPDTYYSQAGLADIYIGKNEVTGSTGALGVNEQYQDDIYNQGRVAYFSQGKFGDKLRVTTHFDSKNGRIKDIFKHPFASDSSDVFDILEDDDELYYGDYGDGANIHKVVNTKGKVYLNLEYDKSQALWGNYNTGLTGTDNNDYNRSLYGFKGDYRTRSTTKFGEDRLNVVGFAASADSAFAHDEFLGTGGSLYFLRHGEVVPGSDKVFVKVVNKDSGISERELPLQSGRDYDIDPYQGRIILKRPLSNIISESFGSVISDTPTDGYENYLAVDYEYVPKGSDVKDSMTYGGRVKGWANDYIGIGTNYMTEERDGQDYESYGSDLTLRATEGTYLKAEWAHSKGQQADSNYVSFDGGLTFREVGNSAQAREGDSFQVKGVANLYDIAPEVFGAVGNDIKAWYKSKDAGYSQASQSDDLEQLSYGTELRLQATDELSFATRYTSIEEKKVDGTLETDSQQTELEAQYKVTNHIKVSAAGKQVDELNQTNQKGSGTLAGLRADYIWDSDNSVYVKGQSTVDKTEQYDDNDSVSVGGEFRVFDDLSLGAEYTTGDRGDATQATASYDITSDYTTYVTYTDDDYEGDNNVIIGQRADLTSNVDFYQENQFVDDNNGKGRIDSFGFGYDMTDDIDFGIGYQQGEIEKQNEQDPTKLEVTHRRAITFTSSVDIDNVALSNKIEFRVDEGNENVDPSRRRIDQFVTTNRYTHNLTEEYTLFGKFNYSKSVSKETDETLERFVEATGGIAYRPIYNDRLNVLSRYTYIADKDNLDRDVDYSNEESHIVEIEGIYSVNAKVDVGAKYAHKDKKEDFERASGAVQTVESNINLYGLSTSYHIIKEWDITGEYHWKTDTLNDELEHGALLSVNKHLSDNFKIGVGYNFSGFDGNLVNDDDYDAKGVFINLIGKI
ncbi:hypothetical protein [Vibrio sp. M260118]|uniref:hypothetical protein n=1 Tax=Vibrio sp. M260118 TaxID=3020896 RepID=UPI002F41F6ED